MNWALQQRTDGPSAQSVLFVIADSANEHGTTFHCNPEYIAEKTRQSRGTVFRRMAELEEVGGLERFTHHKQDGRRTYEVRLNFDARLNYKIDREGTIIHLDDNDNPIEPDESQIDTQGGGESQIDTQTESPSIHPESHSCNSQESNDLSVKNPKIPTPTPSKVEGVLKNQPQQLSEAAEQRFREFKAAYPDGIVDLDKAQKEFAGLSDADQAACVTAAPVYAARCRKRREKSKKAHLFIRERAWLGLMANAEARLGSPTQHPPETPAGRALLTLARIARCSPLMIGTNIVVTHEVTTQIVAIANAPPEQEWQRYKRGTGNFAAWRDLAGTIWPGRGFSYDWIDAPWPWPPRKDGSIISTTGADPPHELSDEDARALSGT